MSTAKRSDAWKDVERRTADKLGGRRLGATGKANPDVVTPRFAVECKHRAKLPNWQVGALARVRAQAKAAGQTGLLVLHQSYARDSMVCIALSDFQHLVGDAIDIQQVIAGEGNENAIER